MKLGIDVGSVTAKVVVLDESDNIVESRYTRTRGQPVVTILSVLEDVLSKYPPSGFDVVGATGTGGRLISGLLGIPFVNEIIAQAAGTARFHPEVKSILEIGGEDSKLILLGRDSPEQAPKVADFAMNGACAAGTGSFLDQQASRMGIPIERFGDMTLVSENPPRVAGRCSVFAKTDMIHLQQVGTPVHDIVAGLCFAMVRNFKGNVIGGRELPKPVAFQGGVAANKGIIRAIEEVLELDSSELIIPQHFAVLGSFGAAKVAGQSELSADSLERLREYISKKGYSFVSLQPLVGDDYFIDTKTVPLNGGKPIGVYIGVDIGSISTNVVVIDKDDNVLSRRYLMTAGRPIEAVTRGLYEVWQELGDRVIVKGTGSTGSGRYMTGEFFGADVVRNEITSHARAATTICPDVDTIFEIGGQDAKYVSIKGGTIIDFAMNKVCAAGTGSFLEEQSEKLDIKIDDFGSLALSAKSPLDLGERCTVFMESQLNYHKQKGASRKDLLGGLAYSVVKNYLNKVVEDHRIGDSILFQGGVAFNRSVKAAFESILGKKVKVPPQHDILGAIGVAMLARDEMKSNGRQTRFRGFDLRDMKYELSSFECHDCANHCEIHKVVFGDAEPLYYGSRCGKYDSEEKKEQRKSSKIANLFKERAKALRETYAKKEPDNANGKTVGIPRALFFHELFPLWKAFFTELGFNLILSDATSRDIIRLGAENVIESPCLPIKVAHGHVLNVLSKGPDYIFLPVQCTMEKLTDDFKKSWNCPLTQSLPFLVRSSSRINEELAGNNGKKPIILSPVFHADRGRTWQGKVLKRLAFSLGVSDTTMIEKAITAGFEALDSFNSWQQKRGQEVLKQLGPDEKAIVILGRAYNTCDSALTLDLPRKLRDLGVMAIPLDFLPLSSVAADVSTAHPNMYWKSGQKIMCAAKLIADDPRLFGIYLTNFGCGPDSYILKFFGRETEGKPFLTIEIDEHSADAGVVTRCEAFIDTIHNARTRGTREPFEIAEFVRTHTNGKRVFVPYMIDHGYILAAAMKYCGQDAEALPESDATTLEIGSRYTSGKECYPSIITTGDIVKRTMKSDFDPKRSAFFMPGASGPCRFGQYNKLHRLVLDEIGFPEVPILVFDQTRSYHDHMATLGGTKFRLQIWKGIVALDLMQKMLLERRPYEVNKGETDAVYKDLLGSLIKVTEQDSDFRPFTQKVTDGFNSVKIDNGVRKPRVGMVGEIFVRSNPFANDYIVRKLEALGAQCAVPPLEEWIDYIDFQRKRRFRYHIEGGWKDWMRQKITEIVQERSAEPLRKHFDRDIECFARELPTNKILELGQNYISPEIEGEAVLSMGRSLEYIEQGFDGIVNIMPFGCMPGTIVSMLFHLLRQEHNIPVFNLVVDGTKEAGLDIRLEAFVHQCLEHKKRSLNSSRLAH